MEKLVTCPLCTEEFNLQERMPKIIFPCGHTVCDLCLKQMNAAAQDNYVCTFNHAEEVPIQHAIPAIMIVEQLKSNFGNLIYCCRHSKKAISFINIIKKYFFCAECVQYEQDRSMFYHCEQHIVDQLAGLIVDSSSKQEEWFKREHLKADEWLKKEQYRIDEWYRKEMLRVEEVHKKEKQRLHNIEEELNFHKSFGLDLQAKKGSFNGEEAFQKMHQAFEYFQKHKIENNFTHELLFSFKKLYVGRELEFNSQIMRKNFIHNAFLSNFIDQKYVKANLFYRASEDGFKSYEFHSRCDKKGPTVVILQSEDDYVFGGFTKAQWDKNNQGYLPDDEAFLFSLTHSSKHMILPKARENAIYNSSLYLCIFGGGNDIWISNECNTNSESYSNFGHTYQLPLGLTFESEEAKSYLAGKPNFKLKNIEVYKLVEGDVPMMTPNPKMTPSSSTPKGGYITRGQ